ncbi:MAG TPA: DMT family protein [Saprospiraceae bacterium]|nr:DMT family protein [Saprospiraceae bacterium]HNT22560.1 DMT family protein [Saprospiraceae bacterium]
MKSLYTILLLLASNAFMTMAWYGHLKYSEWKGMHKMTLISIILLSWGIAFFEYCLMVPANRIGYKANGGPFTLVQLKVIQEVITLLVFSVFTVILFKNESLKWNHGVAFLLLVLSVYFVFRK